MNLYSWNDVKGRAHRWNPSLGVSWAGRQGQLPHLVHAGGGTILENAKKFKKPRRHNVIEFEFRGLLYIIFSSLFFASTASTGQRQAIEYQREVYIGYVLSVFPILEFDTVYVHPLCIYPLCKTSTDLLSLPTNFPPPPTTLPMAVT